MHASTVAFGCGVVFLIATFHPRLGPRVYGMHWPGQYTDPQLKRLALRQGVLVGSAWILLSMVLFLQSFHIDVWTMVSLVLLIGCACCVVTGLVMERQLQRRRWANRTNRIARDA
jgi:peptidoglycan/LPS O-acetylase OafA/YrhL